MYQLRVTLRSQVLYFGPYASTIHAMADAYLLLKPSEETVSLFGAPPFSLDFDVSIFDDRGDVVMLARHGVGAGLLWHRDLTQSESHSIEIAVLSREQEGSLMPPSAGCITHTMPLQHCVRLLAAA